MKGATRKKEEKERGEKEREKREGKKDTRNNYFPDGKDKKKEKQDGREVKLAAGATSFSYLLTFVPSKVNYSRLPIGILPSFPLQARGEGRGDGRCRSRRVRGVRMPPSETSETSPLTVREG